MLKLELIANGVAGRIPEALFNLKHLQHLDLNDNDLRGEIPASIADAKDLRYLRLSYNRLTRLPDSISNLTNLALVHLHNNRMEGDGSVINLLPEKDIPKDYFETLPPHRFISDCGDPQDVSDGKFFLYSTGYGHRSAKMNMNNEYPMQCSPISISLFYYYYYYYYFFVRSVRLFGV